MLAAAVWLATGMVVLGLGGLVPPEAAGKAVIPLFLATFAGLALGVWLAARLLHRRRPVRLIGPDGFRPDAFGLGIAVIVVLGALFALPMLALASPVRNLGLGAWAAWLPLVLPAILVQTAAEELAFRGYLMQALAARFRSPAVWLLVPAGLFGIMHWNPAEFGPNAWLAVASATAIGLVLGDLTARTGNLSLAMGLHFANNVSALLVISLPSPLAALALWVATVDPADTDRMRTLLVLDVGTTLALYAIWLAVCARWRRLQSQGSGSI
jgi:membrane protease YdiL (CAAX protease family)